MKDMIKTYSTFIIYSYLPILVVLGFYIFGKTYSSSNMDDVLLLNIICDFSFIVILSIINFDIFKKHKKLEGKTTGKKVLNFIKIALLSVLILYGIKMIVAIFVAIIQVTFKLNTKADNQDLVEQLFKMAPVLNIIMGVVLAPITEELVFRGAVRRIIKNNWVFVIVSGLLFGLVHVLSTNIPIFVILILGCLIDVIVTSKIKKKKKVGLSVLASVVMLLVLVLSLYVLSGNVVTLITSINVSEAVNSLVYIAMGIGFAFIYKKYDNIYLNILCHSVNNAIGYILLLTLL